MTVLAFDYQPKSTPASSTEVSRVLRYAALALGSRTGLPVCVRRVRLDGSVGMAFVRQSDFWLRVSVGFYSTLRARPLGVDVREWLAERDISPREFVAGVRVDVEAVCAHHLGRRHFLALLG